MAGKSAAAAVAVALLVSMPACRIPGDTTTPGSTTTTPSITSIAVTQAIGSAAHPTVSEITIEHKGNTVLKGALFPQTGSVAASPTPVQTGEIEPGPYTINVSDSACPPSGCNGVKPDPKKDCSVTIIVKKGEAIAAIIHVNKRSCSIEVG